MIPAWKCNWGDMADISIETGFKPFKAWFKKKCPLDMVIVSQRPPKFQMLIFPK
jgi:hypothetical protein